MRFPTDYKSILARIDAIDPVKYSSTRNFIDGKVTYLSPYISRGVISSKQVKDAVLAKGYKPYQIEKFLQELAWREYWQRTWWQLGDTLFTDIKREQSDIAHRQMIKNINAAKTGIHAIDEQIGLLYETGYMHNHVRMYLAGIACNIGKAHWLQPAQWMYHHLLDGDLASNSLSWQWVAGSFSSKKYIANQENINKYLHSKQTNTFLDVSYDVIFDQPIPAALQETILQTLVTVLPPADPSFSIDTSKPILLYNSYNLDPMWRKEENLNRVLLLEPSHFQQFPVSEKVMAFILQLAKENIPGIQVFSGEVKDLPGLPHVPAIISIDHPITRHYPGSKDPYNWMFPEVQGNVASFFSFWKKAAKYLKA